MSAPKRSFFFKRPTASNVEAFVKCGASHALPQHESYQSYTEKGTDGHKLLCDVINMVPGAGGRLEASYRGLGPKLAESMVDLFGARAEEAYVVDVEKRTSELIGVNIDRKYEETLGRKLREHEICTSLDVHARRTDGRVRWVRDFKFGVTSTWWQLYIQCMAVLWMPGVTDTEVDAGFLFVDNQDEDDIQIHEESATVYLMDLDDRADELMAAFAYAKKLQAQLDEGTPYGELKVVEGKWCIYCGAYPNCPAKWKLAKSMLELDVVDHIEALTLEQCGAAWEKLAEIKKNIVAKTEAALKVRMGVEGGFPTAGGKLIKLSNMTGRTTVNKAQREQMIAMLRKGGYADAEIAPLMTRGDDYQQVRTVNMPKGKKP